MKRIILLVLGILLLILGIIGLALPIVPQVPFLFGAACLLVSSSKRVRKAVLENKIYKMHLEPHIKKSKYFSRMWEKITSKHNE